MQMNVIQDDSHLHRKLIDISRLYTRMQGEATDYIDYEIPSFANIICQYLTF